MMVSPDKSKIYYKLWFRIFDQENEKTMKFFNNRWTTSNLEEWNQIIPKCHIEFSNTGTHHTEQKKKKNKLKTQNLYFLQNLRAALICCHCSINFWFLCWLTFEFYVYQPTTLMIRTQYTNKRMTNNRCLCGG